MLWKWDKQDVPTYAKIEGGEMKQKNILGRNNKRVPHKCTDFLETERQTEAVVARIHVSGLKASEIG